MNTAKQHFRVTSIASILLVMPCVAFSAETALSAVNPDEIMDMSTLDISDMDHSGMDMSDMDHSGMDMSDMDHSGMDMSDMDHSSMDMSGMDMSGMDMSDMDHSSMDMSGMDHSSMDMSGMDHSGMDMSGMDHSGMDMSGMDHSGMDMSGMDHSGMDMSGIQGGEPPKNARSPDYSNGVPYGRYGKPVMMGTLPMAGIDTLDLGYGFDEKALNFTLNGWYGTDARRLFLNSEGSYSSEDNEIDSLTSLSYWQPADIFWNTHLGVAYDTKTDKPAIMAGIVGTAPYFIETEAKAYLYSDGQVKFNMGAEYEWRLNQRWVVIPEIELTGFSKEDKDNGITQGFNELEAQLRMTYETLSRQVMPYVSLNYHTALGATRDLHRNNNESVDSSEMMAGVSVWF